MVSTQKVPSTWQNFCVVLLFVAVNGSMGDGWFIDPSLYITRTTQPAIATRPQAQAQAAIAERSNHPIIHPFIKQQIVIWIDFSFVAYVANYGDHL